jgi:HEAT repeat protein
MTKRWFTVRNVFIFASLLAGIGFLVPCSSAYLPSLLFHYSHYQEGHSLGYWVRALKQPNDEVRLQAIEALGGLGPDAAEVVPELAKILTDDPDDNTRHQAVMALAKIAPASAAAVPALARALDKDEVLVVRMDAAIALSRLGTQARPAVPILIRAMQRRGNRTNLTSFTFTIQEMAAIALGRVTAGTPDGVAALLEALQSARTASKRRLVANALGDVGAPSKEAEPSLRALLTDDSPEVRKAAKEALQKILGE